jgi:hypothetical protein
MKTTKHGDYEMVVRFEPWSAFKVYVIFTDDLAKARVARYGSAGVAAEEGTAALFTRGNGGYGHLFLHPDSCARIIAHECWHAVWWMFKWAGVADWDNETCAYHLGYLVGKVSEFQAKVLGVKSSGRKQAGHEHKDTSGVVVGVQDVPAHSRGTSTSSRETGAPVTSAQADGCGDIGPSS